MCFVKVLENASKCKTIIRQAAAAGAQLISLPEASDFIARSDQVLSLTQSQEAANFMQEIQRTAKEVKAIVQVGVHEICKEAPKKVYNTNHLISEEGKIIKSYRKLHLFDVDVPGGSKMLESNTTQPGDAFVEPVQTCIGQFGLLTCYDIRFPEASLYLRRQGAEILSYPSAFTPQTGAAHWEVLLRARAIETQTYVIASTQSGQHYPAEVSEDGSIKPGRTSFGRPKIVDPWGIVICEAPTLDHPTFALAHIDLDYLHKIRVEMPLWKQRRTDIYPVI